MLDRWIKAQRIGLAAYRLNLLHRSSRSRRPPVSHSVEEKILTILEEEINSGCALYPYFVSTLPPVVLKHMTSIPSGLLEDSPLYDKSDAWRAALDSLLGNPRDKESDDIPPLIGARILAYHILHSTGKPKTILRLAKTTLSHSWHPYKNKEDVLPVLESGLYALRSPWEDSQANLDAIELLSTTFSGTLSWVNVENILYQQIFCWPLVLPSEIFADSAISLPVRVDVCFDDRAKEADEGVEIRGSGAVITSGWVTNLRKVVRVARRMWRAKHGNYGSFRKKVEGASVIFDFHVADKIVAGFPTKFTLEDSSMEAYLSQVVLSRLLGNSLSLSRIVTGEIGAETHEFGNYEFIRPEGVSEKLKYVFLTRAFERLILPDPQGLPMDHPYRRDLRTALREYKSEQSTEINFVSTLQNVADSFQTGSWRQFRYVRCPDISWHIHPDGQRLPKPDRKQVADFLDILHRNTDSVLEVTEEMSPLHLAGALWHINTKLREQIPLAMRPPMISWAFIRVIPEEQDSKFWHVIWKVIGASAGEFDAFHQTSTPQQATANLAEVMNCFSPPESSRSHRSPDVIVILGTKYLNASLDRTKNPSLRSHAFDSILEQLRRPGVLLPTPNPLMRSLLGHTRIIAFTSDTVQGDSEVDTKSPPAWIEKELLDYLSLLRVGEMEQELLHCLSTFRFGFTQSMADILWSAIGYTSLNTRDLLKLFVEKGYLRYGSGEYHLPGRIGQTWESSGNDVMDAKKHYAAGVAMAPYLLSHDTPSIPFDEAFNPQFMHEAEYHLQIANRSLDNPHDPFRIKIRNALDRLLRFAMYPGWNSVNKMMRAGNLRKDAYEFALELLDTRRSSGSPPHPVHLLVAAEATTHWWENLQTSRNYKDEEYLQLLVKQIEDLYEEAEKACHYPEFYSERDYNRLKVLTQHAESVYKRGLILPSRKSHDNFERLNSEAFELLAEGVDGTAARGSWYECVGDDIQSNKEAADIYRLGISWVPTWYPLWMKLIGASCLAFGDVTNAEIICTETSREDIDAALHYSLGRLRYDKKRAEPLVYARWKSCINLLRRLFRSEPKVQKQLRLYESVLIKWQQSPSFNQH